MKIRRKKKVLRPNALIYFVAYIFILPLLLILFRLKVDRSRYKPPKGAFIAISNHKSFMDFLLTMITLYPRRFNTLAAQKFFYYKPLHWLLPVMGSIPKCLFDPDVRSIMGMMSVIKDGGRVLIFPEGRCSVDGMFTGIHRSTGKLVKKLNVPVVSCYIEGSDICMPFWRKGFRLGRVHVNISNLFTVEEIEQLSVDEINEAIGIRLGGLDIEKPSLAFSTLRNRRLAEGLQNILYLCPNCKKEFTLTTSNNMIKCNSCGFSALFTKEGFFTSESNLNTPKTIHEWYKIQSLYELNSLSEDMEPLAVNVSVRVPSKNTKEGLIFCGEGVLYLNPKGWKYIGEMHEERVEIFFPIDTVPAIPFDPNDNFQIYSHGMFYAFTPTDNKKACIKYATLGEAVYHRFVVNNQMVNGLDSGFVYNVY